MLSKQRWLKSIYFLAWSVLLTGLTFVFAGIPMKVFRRLQSREIYWLTTLVIPGLGFGFGYKTMAVLFLLIAFLIGVYCDLEEWDFSVFKAGFLATFITTLFGAGIFVIWTSHITTSWQGLIQQQIEQMLKPLANLKSPVEINAQAIFEQLPSIFVMLLLVTLFLAIWLERRFLDYRSVAEARLHARIKTQMRDFRLPEFTIWFFITALLAGFGQFNQHWLEIVGVNVLNICLLLYFFQGLAVIVKFFDAFKMNWFWQALIMVVMVTQLFLVVSLIGVTDYWVNFRSRFGKKTPQVNKERFL